MSKSIAMPFQEIDEGAETKVKKKKPEKITIIPAIIFSSVFLYYGSLFQVILLTRQEQFTFFSVGVFIMFSSIIGFLMTPGDQWLGNYETQENATQTIWAHQCIITLLTIGFVFLAEVYPHWWQKVLTDTDKNDFLERFGIFNLVRFYSATAGFVFAHVQSLRLTVQEGWVCIVSIIIITSCVCTPTLTFFSR